MPPCEGVLRGHLGIDAGLASVVHDRHQREVPGPPARLSQPVAEVGLFRVDEEALVQVARALECLAAAEHERTRCPVAVELPVVALGEGLQRHRHEDVLVLLALLFPFLLALLLLLLVQLDLARLLPDDDAQAEVAGLADVIEDVVQDALLVGRDEQQVALLVVPAHQAAEHAFES